MSNENDKTKQRPRPQLMRFVSGTLSYIRQLMCFHEYNFKENPPRPYFLDDEAPPKNTSINQGYEYTCKKCGKKRWWWTGWMNF